MTVSTSSARPWPVPRRGPPPWPCGSGWRRPSGKRRRRRREARTHSGRSRRHGTAAAASTHNRARVEGGAMTRGWDQRLVRRVVANDHAPGGTAEWPASIPAVARSSPRGSSFPPASRSWSGRTAAGSPRSSRPSPWRSAFLPKAGQPTPGTPPMRPSRTCGGGSGWNAPRVRRGGGTSCAPRRCTGSTPTWRRTPARTRATPTFTGSATASRSWSCCGPASTHPASTASTSPRQPCRSRGRSRWSAPCPSSRRAAPRCCARRTPRSWRRSPAPHVLEVGDWGLRPSSYDDLELVAHWRRYLDEPMRYLRHVL